MYPQELGTKGYTTMCGLLTEYIALEASRIRPWNQVQPIVKPCQTVLLQGSELSLGSQHPLHHC